MAPVRFPGAAKGMAGKDHGEAGPPKVSMAAAEEVTNEKIKGLS